LHSQNHRPDAHIHQNHSTVTPFILTVIIILLSITTPQIAHAHLIEPEGACVRAIDRLDTSTCRFVFSVSLQFSSQRHAARYDVLVVDRSPLALSVWSGRGFHSSTTMSQIFRDDAVRFASSTRVAIVSIDPSRGSRT
jgi:hypothetical protein